MKRAVLLVLAALALTAPAHGASGTVSVSGSQEYGGTLTVESSWTGVKRNQAVRVQVTCQLPDTSVVYGDVRDLSGASATSTFVLGSPEQGTSEWDGSPAICRVDLFAVARNGTVEFLAEPVTFAAG